MKWVIGVDEVGRGPLAGPITVCAFAVRESELSAFSGNFDSKKATREIREEISSVCKALASSGRVSYRVAYVQHSTIDKFGLTKSVNRAITRALTRLELSLGDPVAKLDLEVFLDGGLRAPKQYKNQKTIIGGDHKVPVIGMASMIAKVHRDNRMRKLAREYPEYGFDKHKGYGTRAHYAAIKKHGPSPVHRKLFLRKFSAA